MNNAEQIRKSRMENFDNSFKLIKQSKAISKKKLHINDFLCRGIYFLYYGDEIVYIGQSRSNVMKRICDHEKECVKIFDSFKIYRSYDITDSGLDLKEKKYIKKFQPKYNIVHNSYVEKVNDNPNECNHKYDYRYDKKAAFNFCILCNKKIANKYNKCNSKPERKRISKHNSDEEYNDRYIL